MIDFGVVVGVTESPEASIVFSFGSNASGAERVVDCHRPCRYEHLIVLRNVVQAIVLVLRGSIVRNAVAMTPPNPIIHRSQLDWKSRRVSKS